MKFITLLISLFICQLFLAQEEITLGKKSKRLTEFFNEYHLQPPKLDSSYGVAVGKNLLKRIDRNKVLFSLEEEQGLLTKAAHLADEIQNEKTDFFEAFQTTYKDAVDRSKKLTDHYFAQKQDLNKNLTFSLQELENYVPAQKLQGKWDYLIRLDMLEAIADRVEELVIAPNDQKALDTLIPTVTETIKNSYADYLKNLTSLTDELDGIYLNALAEVFDPHSNFFSPEDKASFTEELQSERELFGINYRKNSDGKIEITAVTPGSSAWLSGEVHVGDIVEALTFGDLPRVVLQGMTRYEMSKLFDQTNSKELEMELINKKNERVKVKLVKSRIYSDEDIIKTAVLKGEKNIGYISLPDFYTSWTDTSDLGCANDVAKALIKLKQENIEGLILDLRDNGGGSLKEAIDLVGIFIDFGPVMVRKEYDGEIRTMKDFNRGAIYRNPLIVLINEGSASASEVVAGALQDYNRALIVGRRSFGKATGQSILPLDPRFEKGFTSYEDPKWGYVKITGLGIYRINLNTNQVKGVMPDIELALPFEDDYDREQDYDHVIVLDSIDKKTYYTPFPSVLSNTLKENSLNRQQNDSAFIRKSALYNELEKYYSDLEIITTLPEYLKMKQSIDPKLKQLTELYEIEIQSYSSHTPSYDDAIYEVSDYMDAYRQDFLNKTKTDKELEEAYHILLEIINK